MAKKIDGVNVSVDAKRTRANGKSKLILVIPDGMTGAELTAFMKKHKKELDAVRSSDSSDSSESVEGDKCGR